MKKNILKISLLSFMLIALWFAIVKTNAAPVDISLTITAGTLSCSNSTTVSLTALNTSYNIQSQTWVFAAGSWTCTDNRWTARWWSSALTVILPSDLTANWWNTIPKANVKMSTTITTTAGNLTGTTNMGTLTGIDSTREIYRKTTANTIWTFTATPTIVITVPANQAPGTYTGVITVTNPS